jgi:hypothetical protein
LANYNTNYENIHLKILQHIEGLKNLEFQVGTTLARNIRAEANKVFGEGKSGYPYDFQGDFSKEEVVHFDENQHAVVIKKSPKLVWTLELGMGSQTIKAKNVEYMHFKGKDNEDVYAKEVTVSPRKPTNFIGSAIEETRKDLKKIYKDSIELIGQTNES